MDKINVKVQPLERFTDQSDQLNGGTIREKVGKDTFQVFNETNKQIMELNIFDLTMLSF